MRLIVFTCLLLCGIPNLAITAQNNATAPTPATNSTAEQPTTNLPKNYRYFQNSLPTNAKVGKDISGRIIVGSDTQKQLLLEPSRGALGTRPLGRVTPQQLEKFKAVWSTLTQEQRKQQLTEAQAKAKQAYRDYLKAHPSEANADRTAERMHAPGKVQTSLGNTTMIFKSDEREVASPAGFRDNNGRRRLQAPAAYREASSSNDVPRKDVSISPSASATFDSKTWHRMNAVIQRNRRTGERLVHFKVVGDQQSSSKASVHSNMECQDCVVPVESPDDPPGSVPSSPGNPPIVCPAWGCGGCPPTICQFVPNGPDTDGDGIEDALEAELADSFTPAYHISGNEQSATGFAIMNDAPP